MNLWELARDAGLVIGGLLGGVGVYRLKAAKARQADAEASKTCDEGGEVTVRTMERVISQLVAQNDFQQRAIESLQTSLATLRKAHESCEENHQKLTAEVESLKAHVQRLESQQKPTT